MVPEKPLKYQNRMKTRKEQYSTYVRTIEIKPPPINVEPKRPSSRTRAQRSNKEKPHPALPHKKQKLKWHERPLVVYTISCIQIIVFIVEFIKMWVLTGSPFQTKPTFNPMLGPSSYLLINMGASFSPCMHYIKGITTRPHSGSLHENLLFPCANSTSDDTFVCSLAELCGGIRDFTSDNQFIPNQWWRFITPIFLHSGLVHIGFNLLLQIKLGGTIETQIGHLRFSFIYFASGIAGFILGGNFSPNGIANTGCSGCLFGLIALDLLDLLFNWKDYIRPKTALVIHIVEILISFGIGLLPGLDNFSHIGGFFMGLMLGTAVLRNPGFVSCRCKLNRIDTEDDEDLLTSISPPFAKTSSLSTLIATSYKKPKINTENIKTQLTKFYKNKPLVWYFWSALRLVAISLAITYFALLIVIFNDQDSRPKCSWCKCLSCIPVKGWCDIGNLSTTNTVSNTGFMILALWHFFMRS